MDDSLNPTDAVAPTSGETLSAGAEPAESESDGPPDEIEPGTAIKEEVERFAQHPRAEAARLQSVEAAGESGATPYLYLLHALKFILPAAAVLLGIALLVYYLS